MSRYITLETKRRARVQPSVLRERNERFYTSIFEHSEKVGSFPEKSNLTKPSPEEGRAELPVWEAVRG